MERMKSDYTDDEYLYTLLKQGRPLNETEEHFFCKNVGAIYLYHKHNCRYIGTEIPRCYHNDNYIKGYSESRMYFDRDKRIIDVLGMTRKFQVYGVEAKASVSDFNNGFCAPSTHTYIICPKDRIPKSLIPKNIGLIYVDIPNFHIIGYDDMRGIEVIKPARKRIDARWIYNGQFNDAKYYEAVDWWYDYICFRNTIKQVFNRNNLPIYRRDKKSI